MSAENTDRLVLEVMAFLRQAGLDVWLAGGWAEEARGLALARPHHDIDLIFLAEDFTALDAFLVACPGFEEVRAKRFSHKRAAVYRQVLVEWILAQTGPHGRRTDFFAGAARLDWPEDAFTQVAEFHAESLPILSSGGLQSYRGLHDEVQRAYQDYLQTKPPNRPYAMET